MNETVIEILTPVAQAQKEAATQPPVLYNLYKLRQKSTGLYSSGGSSPSWSKKGKVWNSLKGLSGHLAMHKGHSYNNYWRSIGTPWDDIEIVVLEVRENETGKLEAEEYVQKMKERRLKREMKHKQAQAAHKLQAAKQEYERAKKIVDDFQAQHGA